jgi:hypothetical protein
VRTGDEDWLIEIGGGRYLTTSDLDALAAEARRAIRSGPASSCPADGRECGRPALELRLSGQRVFRCGEHCDGLPSPRHR